jgi:hypothetical protein
VVMDILNFKCPHTPEKTFRPFFSVTAQYSPVFFKPASQGGVSGR